MNHRKLRKDARSAVGFAAAAALAALPSMAQAGIMAQPGRAGGLAAVPGLFAPPLPGIGDADRDASVLPVSGPCPDDLGSSSFGNADDEIFDRDLPRFAGAWRPGRVAQDVDPATVLAETQRSLEEAQVVLASCEDGPPPPDPITVTNDIGTEMRQVNETCAQIRIQFRIYCLANQYEALAQQLPEGGQYHEMRSILKDTAGKLRSLADENVDTTVPPERVTGIDRSKPPVARAPLPAVRTDNVEEVLNEAIVIIADAQILLLRSVEDSEARFAAYQTVATSFDGSMLLLRS